MEITYSRIHNRGRRPHGITTFTTGVSSRCKATPPVVPIAHKAPLDDACQSPQGKAWSVVEWAECDINFFNFTSIYTNSLQFILFTPLILLSINDIS